MLFHVRIEKSSLVSIPQSPGNISVVSNQNCFAICKAKSVAPIWGKDFHQVAIMRFFVSKISSFVFMINRSSFFETLIIS
jgi:hypothetical protein